MSSKFRLRINGVDRRYPAQDKAWPPPGPGRRFKHGIFIPTPRQAQILQILRDVTQPVEDHGLLLPGLERLLKCAVRLDDALRPLILAGAVNAIQRRFVKHDSFHVELFLTDLGFALLFAAEEDPLENLVMPAWATTCWSRLQDVPGKIADVLKFRIPITNTPRKKTKGPDNGTRVGCATKARVGSTEAGKDAKGPIAASEDASCMAASTSAAPVSNLCNEPDASLKDLGVLSEGGDPCGA
jgi:hypothetical protein